MYIINPIWFYLIGVAEAVQAFFLTIGILGMIIIGITSLIFAVETDEMPKFFKHIAILCAIMTFIGTLIPNQKTCYSMAIASVATTENLEYAAEAGKNVIDYITEKAIELIEAGE